MSEKFLKSHLSTQNKIANIMYNKIAINNKVYAYTHCNFIYSVVKIININNGIYEVKEERENKTYFIKLNDFYTN